MSDLLNELTRNLKTAEELGDEVWTKRLKKRIADLEKAEKAAESVGAPAPQAAPAPEKPSTLSKKSKET